MPTIANVHRYVRLALTACATVPMVAYAQEPSVVQSARLLSGTLSFVGHSTVGDFTGVTTSISAQVTGDLASPRGWVEAPVASLNTRNRLRDRDLRASMEVERYPVMTYTFSGATPDTSSPARRDTTVLLLHGQLTIHGVTRVVDVPLSTSRSGNTIHVAGDFPLDLVDYGIGGLVKAFGLLRMQRQIEVRVDLHFLRVIPDASDSGRGYPDGGRLEVAGTRFRLSVKERNRRGTISRCEPANS